MATQILSQIVEYDNHTRAWARQDADGSLIKHYDLKEDALYAALPADLRAWVDARGYDPRAIRAAVLLANGEIKADPDAYGIYSVPFERVENGMRYVGQHVIDARHGRCTCEDHHFKSSHCKHILAARYLFAAWQAEHMPQADKPPSLFALAQAAVKAHRLERDLEALVIWQDASGQRTASLVRHCNDYASERGKHGEYLFLAVSGHASMLRIAVLRYSMLETYWDFCCRQDEYKAWVKELNHG